jgi:glycosyltransferase involved in cell wall biosynthesis
MTKLSVLIPLYNEAVTISTVVRRVRMLPIDHEIVVIDDGSTDGSQVILRELEREGLIDRLLLHPKNQGKGRAIRTGIEHATGDVMVIQDADLEYDPGDLPGMLALIQEGRADAVFGSRFMGSPRRVLYFWHRVGNGILTLLSNMMTDLNLTDMETCYKMVRADLLRSLPLRSERFGIEPELAARLAQSRARLYEVPIRYDGRTYAEGKKIGWRDGAAAVWHIVRFNLIGPRAPHFGAPPLGNQDDATAAALHLPSRETGMHGLGALPEERSG